MLKNKIFEQWLQPDSQLEMKVTMLFCHGGRWKTVARGLSLCSADAFGAEKFLNIVKYFII
jgi:hypothetical protein